MIERLRYLKRMFHSHSFFGWKGYFHLVDLQCKIQNATGTELWNLYEEQHKIMYDYIDRNLKQHRMMDYTGCRAVKILMIKIFGYVGCKGKVLCLKW